MGGTADIRAAGGVLWRVDGGRVHVAVVRRARYDDWSLPKGKLHGGESELAAAVREVGEETGAQVAVSRRVGRTTYRVDGVRKTVAYWAMRYVGGDFAPDDEVDELVWLPAGPARERLSYAVERGVLSEFLALPLPDSVIVLVRHAKAGKRAQWTGEDRLRPLEATGMQQADTFVPFALNFRPDRVVSADRTRCEQTVAPTASALGLEVAVDPAFSDESFEAAPMHSETALLSLAKPGRVTVVCSQGTAIPGLLSRLLPELRSPTTRKGAAWVLTFTDGLVASADYYAGASR